MADTIILCTEDELAAMFERGKVTGDSPVITTAVVFETLCEYYGVNPHWEPNDVY